LESAGQSINLTRLDGNDGPQGRPQALSEARTPPLGVAVTGVVVLQRSPFCSACPGDLAGPRGKSLGLIPEHTHWCWSARRQNRILPGCAPPMKPGGPWPEGAEFLALRGRGMEVAS